jgi:hypothetical protein
MRYPRNSKLVGTSRKGVSAIVDAEDYERISRIPWNVMRTRGLSYAVSNSPSHKGLMHRLILNAPRHLLVDHRNGNGLDNRKKNLRLTTQSRNLGNSVKRKLPISGYRGVQRAKQKGVFWDAIIRVDGTRRVYLGTFANPKEASKAYVAAHRKVHGEFSVYNR